MMCEGGLLVALQKKVTVSYSTTVLLVGAEIMSAESEKGNKKLTRPLMATHCNLISSSDKPAINNYSISSSTQDVCHVKLV